MSREFSGLLLAKFNVDEVCYREIELVESIASVRDSWSSTPVPLSCSPAIVFKEREVRRRCLFGIVSSACKD